MKNYNNEKLSDNFYELYIGNKRKAIRNKSAYILTWASLVMKSLLSFLL